MWQTAENNNTTCLVGGGSTTDFPRREHRDCPNLRLSWNGWAIGAVLVATLLLSTGCAERPPQYQIIPAVSDGDVEKVEALLRDKANVDVNWRAGGGGITALHAAVYENDLEIMQLLIRLGADPNIATRDGLTPLGSATWSGHFEAVRQLLAVGAKVNVQEYRHGQSPLMNAAWKGHRDIVKLLLEHGADRELRNPDGHTALDWARRFGHDDVVMLLETYWPQTAPTANNVANPPEADAAVDAVRE